MLGLWEVGTGPQRLSLHIAFRVDLPDLLRAPESLRAANVTPLDFAGNPTNEPVVLSWMPAASLYFRDPDRNLLEFLSILPDAPELKLGVVGWSDWTHRHDPAQRNLSISMRNLERTTRNSYLGANPN